MNNVAMGIGDGHINIESALDGLQLQACNGVVELNLGQIFMRLQTSRNSLEFLPPNRLRRKRKGVYHGSRPHGSELPIKLHLERLHR